MPRTVEPMASIDPTWYGVILAAIFSVLQLIYQGGEVKGVESHYHRSTVFLYACLYLITLTRPLHTPLSLKISLLFAILALSALLPAAVGYKLWWVPYLSCIRPLFDLPRDLYLFFTDMPLDPFREFCHRIGNAAFQFKLSALQTIQRFVPINVGTRSAQANSNSEGVVRNNKAEEGSISSVV